MRPQCLSLCALFVLFTGCVTFDHRAGFDEVSATVQARSGKRAVWNLGTELDAQVAQDVHALLQNPLTADTAVQVALLNNRESRPSIASLGLRRLTWCKPGCLPIPCLMGRSSFRLLAGRSRWNCMPPCAFSIFFSCRCANVSPKRSLTQRSCK